jgi:hypothetical protein
VASDRGAALARSLLGAEEGEWGGWNGGASHVWVGGAVDGIIGGGARMLAWAWHDGC